MTDAISPRDASAHATAEGDLPHWRVIGRKLEARYRAGSYKGAARLALAVAQAADAADHHPDIDLRYPDLVHVALTTHAAEANLTRLDLDLAATISHLANEAGAQPEPVASQAFELAIDALDRARVEPFWGAVLGYRPGSENDLVDPARVGPPVWFQAMDEPRPQRNRLHVDVLVPHDVVEARLAAALDAGGTLVTDAWAPAFWVLADPEGNEACLCTWQGRDA